MRSWKSWLILLECKSEGVSIVSIILIVNIIAFVVNGGRGSIVLFFFYLQTFCQLLQKIPDTFPKVFLVSSCIF